VANVTAPGNSFGDAGLTAGTTYSYALFAYDTSSNYASAATKTVTTTALDTTPPAVPNGLAAEPRDGAVNVTWHADSDAHLAGYEIYYGTAPTGPWTYGGSTDPSTTAFVVNGLTNGVTYWFTVSAYDTSANSSAKATAVSAAPQHVGGISHCGTLAADETWAAGSTHALTCSVTVPYGVTLTIASGAIVKGYSSTQLIVQGTLIAHGTAASPITFTDVRDDSIGGDYNGDGTATAPAALGWSGIQASEPVPNLPPSLDLDHVQVFYAGIADSQYSGDDDRNSAVYLDRTTTITNSTVSHGGSINVYAAGPITVTGNTVTNTAADQSIYTVGQNISVQQYAYLMPTNVSGNTVSGASNYGVQVVVQSGSKVSPVVKNNVVSSTGFEPLYVYSNQLIPANLTGNTGSSSTRHGIVLAGTLVADLTLPTGSLPLVLGPDYGSTLTVGSGVTLTIDAGVVVKSYGASLTVNGGALIAAGTAADPVVFTSVKDDTAGGDYNQDGSSSAPAAGDWSGITSNDSPTNPASVSLDHVSVRYGYIRISNGGDDRDNATYLARTTSIINSTFLHGASLWVNAVGPVTVTNDTVTNGVNEQPNNDISVEQDGYLSATTVSNNTVSGSTDFGVLVTVRPESTVSPVVQNNAATATTNEPIAVYSNQLIPANLTGNTGTSSTRQGMVLGGTLVANLTLPTGTLPLVLSPTYWYSPYYYGTLTIGSGVTLTINAGVVIKSYGANLAVNGGTLAATGTAASPVVFTSVKDDTAGGDYNKDGNVTTAAAGDWNGISANDSASHPASVSFDHVSVRYAGVSISNGGDDRDSSNYLTRTTSITNSTFLHGSSIGINASGPVTVTGDTVTNASNELPGDDVSVVQNGYLSATTVSGNTLTGASSYGVQVVVNTQSTVSPVVQNNAVSATSLEPIAVYSNQLIPANLTGDTGTASTRQGMVLAGTLVSNLTLPTGALALVLSPNFIWGGLDGYYYGELTVGSGVTLTVNAGVVIKSYGASLDLSGGSLLATGTAASPVVFTSVKDDNAGGDYNKDGTVTTPAANDWYGISATDNGAVPPSVSLDHVSMRYAAISITNNGDDSDPGNYTSRTTSVTNSSFLHGSSVTVHAVGPVTVTGNTITNASNELPSNDITVVQNGTQSATEVTGNTLTGASNYAVQVVVNTQSTVSPIVTNNAASATALEPIAVYAEALIAANLTGNTGTTTTRQGIVLAGRLISNLALPTGSLALVLGPGYGCCLYGNPYDGSLTVGSGTTLTATAGVVIKSYGAGITVDGGTLASTGTAASPVIFTSIKDDTVGGDYNKDGAVTTPSPNDWYGLTAVNGGSVSTTNTQIRYASTALRNQSGSITFRGKLTGNGMAASGNCDPYSGTGYIVDARNVDWGTATGPWPFGAGDHIDQCTLVQPWVGETNYRARYWGGSGGHGGWAGSAWGSYSYGHRYGGDPVDVATGNLSLALTDITVPEPGPDMVFAREYNSQSELIGTLGPKWTNSWDTTLVLPAYSPTSTYDVRWGDGRIDTYTKNANGTFAAAAGNFSTLTAAASAFTATTKNGVTYTFSAAGLLQSVADLNGNTLTVTHDAQGRTVSVQDGAGRTMTFSYAGTTLSKVTDPAGKSWSFGYSTAGDLTSVTDPTGAVISYTYDGNHDLLTATDADGNTVVTNTWDINQRVTSQTDASGHVTYFTYSSGQTSVTDPRGGQTSYTYDANGQILTQTDPTGATTTNTYTAAGLLSKTTDPVGRVTTHTYDTRGNELTVTDPLHKTTTYTYDALNDRLTAVDPTGATTSWTYDAHGNATGTSDPLGNSTSYTADSRGLRTSETDALSHTTSYNYDAAGNQASTSDPLNHVTSFNYDQDGRITSRTDALNHTISYGYNARGDQTTITDALNHTTTTTIDPAGRKTAITDPLGHTTRWTYTPTGKVQTMTDPAGDVTSYNYDQNDNLTTVTDPTGGTIQYGYDAANRRISTTDQLNATSNIGYDADGDITSETDPLGHTTNRGYDADGRLLTVTNALGKTTTFGYDNDGRQTTTKDANGHIWTETYDLAGNPKSSTDPLLRGSTNTYDSANRLTTVTNAAGGLTSYAYDASNRCISVTYPDATTASYSYDAIGQLTGRTDSAGTYSASYNADGQLTQATDALNQTISYGYDAAGRLISRTQPGSVTTTLSYDAAGRVTGAVDPAGNAIWSYDAAGSVTGANLPNGVTLTATSDADHRTTALTYSTSSTTAFNEAITYDTTGNVTAITDPTGTHSYTYDAANRLTSDSVGASTASWTYDAVGNRLTQTSGGTTTSYTYDVADQLNTAGAMTYTYNQLGQLTTISTPAGTTNDTYTGAGYLKSTQAPAGTTTYTVDDTGTVLKQLTGSGTTTYLTDAQSGQQLAQNSTRTLVGAHAYATVTGSATSTIALDALGSGRAMIPTSGSATVTNYSPWGAESGSAPAVGEPGFTGGMDQIDGTVRLGQRVIDPTAGRWTSEDRTGLREDLQQYSLYAYVQENPLLLTDPTGMWSCSWCHSALVAGHALVDEGASVLENTAKSGVLKEVGHVASKASTALTVGLDSWDIYKDCKSGGSNCGRAWARLGVDAAAWVVGLGCTALTAGIGVVACLGLVAAGDILINEGFLFDRPDARVK